RAGSGMEVAEALPISEPAPQRLRLAQCSIAIVRASPAARQRGRIRSAERDRDLAAREAHEQTVQPPLETVDLVEGQARPQQLVGTFTENSLQLSRGAPTVTTVEVPLDIVKPAVEAVDWAHHDGRLLTTAAALLAALLTALAAGLLAALLPA